MTDNVSQLATDSVSCHYKILTKLKSSSVTCYGYDIADKLLTCHNNHLLLTLNLFDN